MKGFTLFAVIALCVALTHGKSVFSPVESLIKHVGESIEYLEEYSREMAEEVALDQELNSLTWSKWKESHNKEYASDEEEAERKGIWESNMKEIKAHNAQRIGYSLGMNAFGDMSNDEFRSKILMQAKPIRKAIGDSFKAPKGFVAKDLVDWRENGTEDLPLVLSEVKNQGQCGSCWAFSAVAALEGQWQRKTNGSRMISLSEQDLVDCSRNFGNMGCNGGLMDNAFSYIKSVGGLDTEDDYPYVGRDEKCSEKNSRTASVTGFVDITPGDEDELKIATASVGPISVAIDASQISFQFYRRGVYNPIRCSSDQLDHGVTVVGYGSESGKDYWLVRNSWGNVWGLQGYIKMARNARNKCGIASSASYPTV